MSLFGPSHGRWLGIPAFILTAVLFAVINRKRQDRSLRCLAEGNASFNRFRSPVRFMITLCGIVMIASIIVMFASTRSAGVAAGTHPDFDYQEEYRLNSHGHYTIVSRTRYLIVGSSCVVGWHAIGTLLAFLGVQLVLFGQLPERTPESS